MGHHWLVMPGVVMIVAYAFLGTEELSAMIENPFENINECGERERKKLLLAVILSVLYLLFFYFIFHAVSATTNTIFLSPYPFLRRSSFGQNVSGHTRLCHSNGSMVVEAARDDGMRQGWDGAEKGYQESQGEKNCWMEKNNKIMVSLHFSDSLLLLRLLI
jgi:hypothetical protein